MMQTYQGYFHEDGRFIMDNVFIKMPVNKRAIVNILDDEVSPPQIDCQRKISALDKILNDALKAEAKNNLSDAEWEEFECLRTQSNFAREIDL